ncbi:MAG: ABC transporter ATP-binding protein [Lachnospiraceae bacterium]
MKKENSIEVKNLKKSFKVYNDKGRTLKELALFSQRRKYESRIVLDDISFEVEKGEAIGLIGRNGCGKSTTLKILSKIMYPDSGTVELSGRVSSLIELGAGFHPDMSGRENIYTNASIFGLNKKEIDSRIDDIIMFSELQEFIDNPVRTYSSGMYMRLAFAVAINVDADILLIDEILAVGDISFQAKCFEKLMSIKKNGTTIVIVSHSLAQIEKICDTSYWVDSGKIISHGDPVDIHKRYIQSQEQGKNKSQIKMMEDLSNNNADSKAGQEGEKQIEMIKMDLLDTAVRKGDGRVRFERIAFVDSNGKETNNFYTGEDIHLYLEYNVREQMEGSIGIGISRTDGLRCFETNTILELGKYISFEDKNMLKVILKDIALLSGEYFIDIAIHSKKGEMVDSIWNAKGFTIIKNKREIGVCYIDTEWKVGR